MNGKQNEIITFEPIATQLAQSKHCLQFTTWVSPDEDDLSQLDFSTLETTIISALVEQLEPMKQTLIEELHRQIECENIELDFEGDHEDMECTHTQMVYVYKQDDNEEETPIQKQELTLDDEVQKSNRKRKAPRQQLIRLAEYAHTQQQILKEAIDLTSDDEDECIPYTHAEMIESLADYVKTDEYKQAHQRTLDEFTVDLTSDNDDECSPKKRNKFI
jgi:hypothetical protein